MAHTEVWWHARWVHVIESVFGHIAAIVVGFVMMVVGLGLGVTMIMLPVLVFSFVVRRYLVSGLTGGAIKG